MAGHLPLLGFPAAIIMQARTETTLSKGNIEHIKVEKINEEKGTKFWNVKKENMILFEHSKEDISDILQVMRKMKAFDSKKHPTHLQLTMI